jgi:CDP-diacylglycerol--glycerol-3-phosphate 3-phosphatidyltransferase
MFDGRWRETVDRNTTPIGKGLVRIGVTADVLTGTGLVFALGTAVAVGTGHLLLGVPLLILTGLPDLLDGPVAKAAGTASVRGAFFDSVTDRVSDALIMGGVAWYLISARRGHEAILPLAILGVTSLISYQRSKAESLGLSAKGGLMERAERMILLGVGFLAAWLLVPVLWALLGLSAVTAIGRFARVWKAAEGPPPRPDRPTLPARADSSVTMAWWRQGRVETRWRAWRESLEPGGTGVSPAESFSRWRARRQEALASRGGRTGQTRRSSEKHTRRTARSSERRSSMFRGTGTTGRPQD